MKRLSKGIWLPFFAALVAVVVPSQATAQTCNEKCTPVFDDPPSPQVPQQVGWACVTTGTNKNCVATTTQCTITMCGGTGGEKIYTTLQGSDGRLLAVLEKCDVSGSPEESLGALMVALQGTRDGDDLSRGVRFARLAENRRTRAQVAAGGP